MEIKIKNVKNILTKSPVHHGYTISPYAGCEHNCSYCYAQYLKDWTNHENERWGEYIDVKIWEPLTEKQKKLLKNKSIMISSATDPYQNIELEYKRTKTLLEELEGVNASVLIVTKNKNIVRDLELIKRLNATIALSINTINESFRADMDNASTLEERFETLKTFHDNNIYTICFISPIFPGITDSENIIKRVTGICDEVWLEHLVLCNPYKGHIMYYIKTKYPHLFDFYRKIYDEFDFTLWEEYSDYMEDWCKNNGYFYGFDKQEKQHREIPTIINFKGHKYNEHRKI